MISRKASHGAQRRWPATKPPPRKGITRSWDSDILHLAVGDLRLGPDQRPQFVMQGLQGHGMFRPAALGHRHGDRHDALDAARPARQRSEEHTSELQSLMRITSAVLCLKKKTQRLESHTNHL